MNENDKLVVKAQALMERAEVENPHRLAMKSRVSAPSMARWIGNPERLQIIYLEVLLNVLRHGLELSDQEILNLKFGDVFEIIYDEPPAKADGKHKREKMKAVAS